MGVVVLLPPALLVPSYRPLAAALLRLRPRPPRFCCFGALMLPYRPTALPLDALLAAVLLPFRWPRLLLPFLYLLSCYRPAGRTKGKRQTGSKMAATSKAA